MRLLAGRAAYFAIPQSGAGSATCNEKWPSTSDRIACKAANLLNRVGLRETYWFGTGFALRSLSVSERSLTHEQSSHCGESRFLKIDLEVLK
jgi:hypothetical protein